MIRVDHLLLGYVTFSVSTDDIARAMDRLLRFGISARISAKGEFNVSILQIRSVESVLCDIPFKRSRAKGLGGFFIGHRHRYGAMLGILFSVAFLFLSSRLIWDVRVSGGADTYDEAILSSLCELGLVAGERVSDEDLSELEVQMLLQCEDIGWINLYKKGAVVYAGVVKRENVVEKEKKDGYANIIAEFDGVIEEITVKEGIALVEVGDTVVRGQTLISGVIPTELGGGYCYASGIVKARRSDTVSVCIPKRTEKKEIASSHSGGFSIEIFGFTINILKKYGNRADGCDIIEKKTALCIGGKRLPISFTEYTVNECLIKELYLSEGEMISLARAQLTETIFNSSAGGELLSARTYGEFCADGYRMWADILVCEDIAKIKEFDFIEE